MLLGGLDEQALSGALTGLKSSRATAGRVQRARAALQKIPVPPENTALRLLIRDVGFAAAADALNLRLAQTGEAAFARALEELQGLRASGACLSLKDMRLDGGALIRSGMAPGPEMGRILNALLDRVIQGELKNQPEDLLAAALELARHKTE